VAPWPLDTDFGPAQILEGITDGFVALDNDWRYTYVNRRAAEILRHPPVELVGRVMWECFPHLPDDPFYKACQCACTEQCMVRVESYDNALDRWIENRIYPGPQGVSILFQDVSERILTSRRLEEKEQRYRSLFEFNRDAVHSFDLAGNFLETNRSCFAISGYTAEELYGTSFTRIIAPEEIARVVGYFRRAVSGEPQAFETQVVHKHGCLVPIEAALVPIVVGGAIVGIYSIARDVSARKRSEAELSAAARQLEESSGRLRLALESGRLGTWNADLATCEFIEVSPIYREICGYAPDAELTHAAFLETLHPDDRTMVETAEQHAILAHSEFYAEYRCLWPDGSVHWLRSHGIPIKDADGRPVSMIGVSQDITEQKELEERRERALQDALYISERDPLTGLLNHRAFHRRLAEITDRLRAENTRAWLTVLDVDNFKFFNDVYGHSTGDEVLRQVASRLAETFGDTHTIARFGGDEFALVLNGSAETSPTDMARVVRKRIGAFSYRPPESAADIPITISVGAALINNRGSSRLDELNLADERLRRSKLGAEDSEATQQMLASLSAEIEGFSMLYSLVTAVDNKDRYTRRHSEDVMNLSVTVAEELGVSAEMRHIIAISALLHDVGKIGVPDNILRKPGLLTPEERSIINNHAEMGAIIVSAVPALKATLDAVRHHHERWDGKGYPAQLAGTDIPLMARIMAVVDAYSAMTTDRPYRRGMEPSQAVAILKEGAGSQWDPECVAAFVRRFGAGEPGKT
jgi:diguanylate cyclase (GGDEF)-like protein/PAS domain S-box-containing protein